MNQRVRNIGAWIVVGVALGAAIYFFGFSSPQRTQHISSDNASLTQEQHTIEKRWPGNSYTIEVHYPLFSGLPHEKIEPLNAAITSFVEGEVAAYEQEAKEFSAFIDPELSPGTLSSEYTVLLSSPHLISIRFNISSYMSGAAHPLSHATGFTFDVNRGERVMLADLFEPGADYLERLSDITRTHLLQARARTQETSEDQQQEQWIREGTQPSDQNFAHFVLSPTALVIYFNPYQVAPFAAGIQEVNIPYRDILGLLSDTGPATYLTAN